MNVCSDITQLRQIISQWRLNGEAVAFVPTMGNLHAGHFSLVDVAQQQGQRTVVSIFVNPMQFGPDEDFDRYPRTLEDDLAGLEARGVDLVFTPGRDTIYPGGEKATSYIEVPGLSDILEGEFRPGFFRGVATVVLKLLNIVQPDIAVFGEKDFQQLLVIKRMVADLDLPVKIVAGAIRREPDGLAMSSRNRYLSDSERDRSIRLNEVLRNFCSQFVSGYRDCRANADCVRKLIDKCELDARGRLETYGFDVDYVSLRDAADLMLPDPAGTWEGKTMIVLLAAHIGNTRLIDNLQFLVNSQ